MTEPVAYRVDGKIYNNIIDAKFAVREIENFRNALGIDNGLIRTPKYLEPLYTAEQLHPRVKMTQEEFDELEISLINAQFDYSELKKTIEIVPNMKWFVRSKEPEDELRDFIFLSGSNLDDLDYLVFDYARAFDTKEEAEKWTNPLTEAVQLPVEE